MFSVEPRTVSFAVGGMANLAEMTTTLLFSLELARVVMKETVAGSLRTYSRPYQITNEATVRSRRVYGVLVRLTGLN